MPAPLIVTSTIPLDLIRATGETVGEDKYRQVGFVKHPDGVLLRFTERVGEGRISAGLFRYFNDAGNEERESAFFALRHIGAAHQLLDVADEHMLRLESEALDRLARQRASGRR